MPTAKKSLSIRSWASPVLPQRTSYVAKGPVEKWMVPLLGEAIESAIVKHAVPFGPNPRCLDVGCGSQPWRALLETTGYEYYGMDFNQNAEGTVHHIGAIDTAITPELQGQEFEFLLCTEVIEHVARWPEAFRNLSALLKPGGQLLITAPHIWLPHEEPADFFRPTSLGIEYHANAAGLRTEQIERLGTGYDVLSTILAGASMHLKPGKIWARSIRAIPRATSRLLLAMLQSSLLKNHVELKTDFYLSTIAVFEKEA
jgi:SAM-dependent methyltransferase